VAYSAASASAVVVLSEGMTCTVPVPVTNEGINFDCFFSQKLKTSFLSVIL
jgi:hypothetical protein